MTLRRARAALSIGVALEAGILVALAAAARDGASPSTVTWGLALAFAPYAIVVASARAPDPSPRFANAAVLTVLFLGAVLVAAPPVLSDDVYRYSWEGRLWLEGHDPYRVPPDHPSLAPLRDAVWASINHKSLATIYPPLSQAIFALAAALGGHVWTLKLFALLGHALGTHVVIRATRMPEAGWAFGLNPMLLGAAALDGHLDALVGASLLIAASACSSSRFARAGVAIVTATALKVVGLVMLPLLWVRRRVFVLSALGCALVLIPLLAGRAVAGPVSGAGQFAARWRGNESVFALLEWAARQAFEPELASVVARGAAVALLLAVVLVVVRAASSPMSAARVVLWAVLLLSPQVHPWYLAWLLPLDLAVGGVAGLVWSATALVAYAPVDRWVVEGVWEASPWLQGVEYAPVFLALAWERWSGGLSGSRNSP